MPGILLELNRLLAKPMSEMTSALCMFIFLIYKILSFPFSK